MSDFQRKRKLTKKGLILSAACGFLLATAAGCGKAEEEGLQIEAIGEERDASEDDAADDTDENAGENGAAKDADENAGENGAADDTDENAGEDGAAENTDQSAGGGAKLEGDVLSLSTDSFVVARNETFEEGDASYMVGAAPSFPRSWRTRTAPATMPDIKTIAK